MILYDYLLSKDSDNVKKENELNIVNDLISIIVPVYKVEKYLNRCIDSILNQTYKNLEIILVDDGSPDNCGKICDDYKKMDKRIKVIHKKNGGLSDARNFGIKIASGKYIGFVDSDDFISKEMYEKLYYLLKENKADISVISYKCFYEIDKVFDKKENINNVSVLSAEESMQYLFENSKIGNYAWNKLYKTSLFSDIEYPFGKKMEDLGTTYKLFNKCNRIAYCDIELYYYLQRQDSILHSTDAMFCNDKFELCYERFIYLKEKYPNLKENYTYIFENALRLYPFLNSENKLKADRILKQKIYKSFTLGLFVRFVIYKFSKNLYGSILRKREFKQ